MQIVGRQSEQTRLQDALERALAGRGQLVLVGGESGIGKTTLVEQFVDDTRAGHVLVLSGSAYESPIASPFGAWIDLLRDLPDEDVPRPPRELQMDGATPAAESRISLFYDMVAFLHALERLRPTLLVLEDLHWADRASLELLGFVAHNLGRLRILIVGTYRHDEARDAPFYQSLPNLSRGSANRIQLHRLINRDVRQLLRERYELGKSDTARLADSVQQLAEGNPLFIEEILRTLEGDGTLRLEEDSWKLGGLGKIAVPPLILQLVDNRLARADQSVRDALSKAAVLGDDVSIDHWEQLIADEADLGSIIEQALRLHVMREIPGTAGQMCFSHSVIREAVYARLPPTERRTLHRTVAETLATDARAEPGVVAYHYEQAGQHRHAIDWLIKAGERARELHAYESVLDAINRALTIAGPDASEIPLDALRSRAQAHARLGDFGQARGDLERALRRARSDKDQQAIWQILLELGSLWTERDYTEANSYLEQALRLARDTGSDQMIAASLNRVGNLRINGDLPQESISMHQEALEISESLHDEAGIAEALDFLGIANYMHGDLTTSAAYYRRAIRRFRVLGDIHGMASALPTLMMTGGSYESDTVVTAPGSLSEWRGHGREGLRVAEEAGWRAGMAYALVHIGYFEGSRGNYGAALDAVRDGLALAERIGHRQWIIASHFVQGLILNDLLQVDQARTHLERALDGAWEIHSRYWLRATTAGLVDVCLSQDKLEEAEHLMADLFPSEQDVDSIAARQCWMRKARLDLARDRADAALDTIDVLRIEVPGDPPIQRIPNLEWLRGCILAKLGRDDEAEQSFRQALKGVEELEFLPLGWRIWHELTHLYDRSGDREQAAHARIRSRAIIDDLANSIEDGDLRFHFLRNLPSALRSPDTEDSLDLFGLSRREREVLTHTADGLTDAEIGEQLFISPRTVGRHLQSIYNKLGVNSRTAAVSRALEHGVL